MINTTEQQKNFADSYIMINANKFNENQIFTVKEKLAKLPVDRQTMVQSMSLKDPIVALLISFFVGCFGIDRFYVGNIVLGILKLLTLGGLGIWALVDLFLIMRAARTTNFNKIMSAI